MRIAQPHPLTPSYCLLYDTHIAARVTHPVDEISTKHFAGGRTSLEPPGDTAPFGNRPPTRKMTDMSGRKVFKVFNQDFIVDERYTVTKELGQGAYGIVW